MNFVSRIIGLIIITFLCAALYGFGCAAMDVLKDQKDPVTTGRYAASRVYSLFGVVTEEANANNANATRPVSPSVARKIAVPYAVTADIAGLLGGKMANGMSSAFHTVEDRLKN